MLTRLSIDNFRTFENFEISFQPLTLLVGVNGSGKTGVFDVLEKLQRLIVDERPCHEVFLERDRSRFRQDRVQTFQLSYRDHPGDQYEYTLILDFDEASHWFRIQREVLRRNDADLLSASPGDVQWPKQVAPWSEVNNWYDGRKSIFCMLARQPETRLNYGIREMLRGLYVSSTWAVPRIDVCETEASSPGRNCEHVLEWLLYLSKHEPHIFLRIRDVLCEFIPGLQSLKWDSFGQWSRLLFEFSSGEADSPGYTLAFSQLSDGQQRLVVLYAFLEAVVRSGFVLCLDEPDNYLALREVQPWLNALEDAIEDHSGQCVLASHHPEVLNRLPLESFRLLTRDESGRSRVTPFATECIAEDMLTPAEVMARGWEEP